MRWFPPRTFFDYKIKIHKRAADDLVTLVSGNILLKSAEEVDKKFLVGRKSRKCEDDTAIFRGKENFLSSLMFIEDNMYKGQLALIELTHVTLFFKITFYDYTI